MNINRNNYEPYFVDYLEGCLNEEVVDEFLEFIQKNPDLKEELLFAEPAEMPDEEISFKKKNSLYKEKFDSETEFNKVAVACIEADISKKEKQKFDTYLSENPERQKDIDLFKKTKLIPDSSITFSKKEKLYKKSHGKTILMWSVRIAAVIILAFAFFVLFDKPTDSGQTNPKMTENKTASQVKEQLPSQLTATDNESKLKMQSQLAISEQTSNIEHSKSRVKSQLTDIREKQISNIQHPESNITNREPLIVPTKINSLTASITVPEIRVTTITVPQRIILVIQNDNGQLIANAITENTKLNKLSSDKLKIAGLKLISGYTRKNLSYKTGENGKITKINYESRLFAFSIPTKTNKKSR